MMEPSGHSFFEVRPAYAPSPRPIQDDHSFAVLRAAVARSRKRFVIVNASAWVLAVGAPTLAGLPVDTEVLGELTVGMVLFAAQAGLLLASSGRLDRGQREAQQHWTAAQASVSFSAGGEYR
ncbi:MULTISPECIES: hypothetical protein [unclassified Streptomyces]|uniref:hypothetical protein n=1 Tax=unclassified Streptomyces TaxID=2593676 RepID=UPI0035D93187